MLFLIIYLLYFWVNLALGLTEKFKPLIETLFKLCLTLRLLKDSDKLISSSFTPSWGFLLILVSILVLTFKLLLLMHSSSKQIKLLCWKLQSNIISAKVYYLGSLIIKERIIGCLGLLGFFEYVVFVPIFSVFLSFAPSSGLFAKLFTDVFLDLLTYNFVNLPFSRESLFWERYLLCCSGYSRWESGWLFCRDRLKCAFFPRFAKYNWLIYI